MPEKRGRGLRVWPKNNLQTLNKNREEKTFLLCDLVVVPFIEAKKLTLISDLSLNRQNEMSAVAAVQIDADFVPIRAAGSVAMQVVVRCQPLVMEAGVFVELR